MDPFIGDTSTFRDFPIKQRTDGSYEVTHGGYICHVTNSGRWAGLFAQVDAYAKANPKKVTQLDYPKTPSLERVKDLAIAKINADVSKKILAGFDYIYAPTSEVLHFSYDNYDQQNFAAQAVACKTVAAPLEEDTPSEIMWTARKQDGTHIAFSMDNATFLELYNKGAQAHKASVLAKGRELKGAVIAATTVEEVNEIVRKGL